MREARAVALAILSLYVLLGRTVRTWGEHSAFALILQAVAFVLVPPPASEQLNWPLPFINIDCEIGKSLLGSPH